MKESLATKAQINAYKSLYKRVHGKPAFVLPGTPASVLAKKMKELDKKAPKHGAGRYDESVELDEVLNKKADLPYHLSVEKGKFMKDKDGGSKNPNALYLHDLDNESGSKKGQPMLVTFDRKDKKAAERAAKKFGGKVLTTRMGTYRVVKEEAELDEKMDPVNKKALKKDFDDRKDKDIDNDGDVDSSDEYLHKRRKAVKKAMKKDTDTAKMNPKADGDEPVDEALKPYDKNADFRVVNRLKLKQRTGTLTPGEKKQLANAQARLRNHGVTESFRDKLLSVLESRAKHYAGASEPEPIDSKDSPLAKKMRKDHEPEVAVDGNEAADETAKNIANSVKAAPTRAGDSGAGDKAPVGDKPEDVTKKAGFKEQVNSIWNAYTSVTEKK